LRGADRSADFAGLLADLTGLVINDSTHTFAPKRCAGWQLNAYLEFHERNLLRGLGRMER